MAVDELRRLAALLMERNALDAKIAEVIGRPMTAGRAGEWIAARAFGIRLEKSASQAAIDGRFGPGPLAGRSVNITWYPSVKVKACSISRSTRNRTGVS